MARLGPKESLSWIEGYERLAELAPRLASKRLACAADREAEMVPLIARAQQLRTPTERLVCATDNAACHGVI